MSCDISHIPPLTEAEADSIANALTLRQRYVAALHELVAQPFVDADTITAIQNYVDSLQTRLVEARNDASRLRWGDS